MGSFGYIAGGALAGGGKAVEQFAAENMAELRMQKIEELRAQHEAERQQTGIEAQKGMQQAGFTEAEKMHAIEYGESVKSATARAGVEEHLKRLEIEARHQDTREAVEGRIKAAGVPRTHVNLSAKQEGPLKHEGDYSLTSYQNGLPIGTQKYPSYTHMATGLHFIDMGGVQVLARAGMDPSKAASARVPNEATKKLLSEPTDDAIAEYAQKYGQVPAGVWAAQAAYLQQHPQGNVPGGPLGPHAPTGWHWTASGSTSGGGDDDDDEDVQERATDNAPPTYSFQTPNTGNYGGSPQANNAPATGPQPGP